MKIIGKIALILIIIILIGVGVLWWFYQASMPHRVRESDFHYYNRQGNYLNVGQYFTDELKKKAWCDAKYQYYGHFATTKKFTDLLATLDRRCKTNNDCTALEIPDIDTTCPSHWYTISTTAAAEVRGKLNQDLSAYLNYCGGRTEPAHGVDLDFNCHMASFSPISDIGYMCYKNKCVSVLTDDTDTTQLPFVEK